MTTISKEILSEETGPLNEASFVGTMSGRCLSILDPDPDDICIEDIAHSLSMQARYNGHTTKFYSVAQHCVLMTRAMVKEHGLREDGYNRWFPVMAALLHDAAEAYLGDIVNPVKRVMGGRYDQIEEGILSAIYISFGLCVSPGYGQGWSANIKNLIEEYDYRMFLTEWEKVHPNKAEAVANGIYGVKPGTKLINIRFGPTGLLWQRYWKREYIRMFYKIRRKMCQI